MTDRYVLISFFSALNTSEQIINGTNSKSL